MILTMVYDILWRKYIRKTVISHFSKLAHIWFRVRMWSTMPPKSFCGHTGATRAYKG